MARRHVTSDEIYKDTIRKVAPLPCQEGYLRQLASIMSFHLHRNELLDMGMSADELPAPSAIIVAPTGQGKTYLLRKMAEAAHINCIIVDCSSLAAEGWRGVSLGEHLLNAKNKIKDDSVFLRSIILLDEIDKAKLWGTRQDQGSPLYNLLQLFNGGFYSVEDSNKNVVNIDTRRFTVILGGAFSGIEEIIRERVCPKGRVGFIESENRIKRSNAELMQMVALEDLKAYGLLEELLGRIGTILTISPLGLEDYKRLLSGDTGSIRTKYDNYFRKLYGVRFNISDMGADEIARKCMKYRTGARAVNPLVHDLMRSAVAEVERNIEISEVILDAGEEGHCIRYKTGPRGWGMYNLQPRPEKKKTKEEKESPNCRIRAKCFPALVNKLCRYYRNAGGDPQRMEQLEAFLNCALLYMCMHTPKENFTFEYLFLLARGVDKRLGVSTFEEIVGEKMAEDDFYKIFQGYYHADLRTQLMESLMVIYRYMEDKNGKKKFYFELKERKGG